MSPFSSFSSFNVGQKISLLSPFTLVRYRQIGRDSWTTVVYSIHIHFWLILFSHFFSSSSSLFCSNGHAIWNRIREGKKKENENRRVKSFWTCHNISWNVIINDIGKLFSFSFSFQTEFFSCSGMRLIFLLNSESYL
jgi:hypothetical protein